MFSRAVCILTFGCQMNKLDSALAGETLKAAGYRLVEEPKDARTVLFNTCAVRDHAEQRIISRIAQAGHAGSGQERIIGVMGCFAERRGAALTRDAPGVTLVVGTRQFPRLPELLDRAAGGETVIAVGDPETGPDGQPVHPEDALPRDPHCPASPRREAVPGNTAYLAVMRGCQNRCAYCIVPDVRGPERSRPLADVVAEARLLAGRGAREIVLLGQNIDAYGRDRPGGPNLADLLEAVHAATEAAAEPRLPRLRFVTSHPRDITPRLVRAVRGLPRMAPHFHMPAQSGASRILAAMNRGYDRALYDERLAMIRELCPEAGVASDFIVGFPGETEEDFAATGDLVARAGFQNSFIFKYSPRPGTPSAENLPDDVPEAEKRRRNARLLEIQAEASRARTAALIGSVVEVLVEGVSPRDPRRLFGRAAAGDLVVFSPDGVVDDLEPGAIPSGAGKLSTQIIRDWTGQLARLEIHAATALTLRGRTL